MTDNEVKTRTVYCLTKNFSDENFDSYIGSTSMSLESRLNWHKFSATQKRCENSKIYRRMNEVGLENWKIVPLLTLECIRNEILTFERKWLEVLAADLNSYLPVITYEETRQKKAEYRAKNREVILRKQAEYRAKNREVLLLKKGSLGCDRELKRHNNSLKHQFTFLNSLD